MRHPAYERLLSITSQNEELESTVAYLTQHLAPIVKSSEAVLICFPREKETDFGRMAEQAVLRCGGLPVFWGEDRRWKELLRLSFCTKASTIIAPPLIILGLSKIAVFEKIPLHFYNAVMAGYCCLDWMMDGIEKGLDCKLWGALGPGISSVLSGFSCDCGRGIHLREEKFGLEIVDGSGAELPDGSHGRVVLYHRNDPDAPFPTKVFGSVMPRRCPCGDPSPKLVGLDGETNWETSLVKYAEELLYWNSILDCVFTKTEQGMELEVVCFPGEKMPKFPSCAKLLVRSWNPEQDCPLPGGAGWILS